MRYEATFEGFRIPKGENLLISHNTNATYRVIVRQDGLGWVAFMIGGGRLGMKSKNHAGAQATASSNFVKQIGEWVEVGD